MKKEEQFDTFVFYFFLVVFVSVNARVSKTYISSNIYFNLRLLGTLTSFQVLSGPDSWTKYIDGCRGVDSQGASTGPLTGGPTKV